MKTNKDIYKLFFATLMPLVLAACHSLSSTSITYEGHATGYDKQITIPMNVITQQTPAPTIIVAHPSDGITGYNYSRYVLFWGTLLKGWGYNVVLPDSFTTRGFRNREVMYHAGLVNYNERAEDIIATATWILKQKWHKGKIATIGFSHGGSAVTRTANLTNLISAGVAYYPGCFNDDGVNNPRFPVQIHIGTADDWTASHRCETLAKANSLYDLYLYKDATHAFDVPGGVRTLAGHQLAYDPSATKSAEERTRLFLAQHLLF